MVEGLTVIGKVMKEGGLIACSAKVFGGIGEALGSPGDGEEGGNDRRKRVGDVSKGFEDILNFKSSVLLYEFRFEVLLDNPVSRKSTHSPCVPFRVRPNGFKEVKEGALVCFDRGSAQTFASFDALIGSSEEEGSDGF